MASIAKFDTWQNSAGTTYGTVLQTVTGYNSGRNSTTSTSYVSQFTSPSITPSSSSSKILVILTTMVGRTGQNGNAYFAVYRNGTTSLLQASQAAHFTHWNDYNTYTQNNTTWAYVDSPVTTASINYQLMAKGDGGTVTAVVGGRPNDGTHDCGVTWTLMEIQA